MAKLEEREWVNAPEPKDAIGSWLCGGKFNWREITKFDVFLTLASAALIAWPTTGIIKAAREQISYPYLFTNNPKTEYVCFRLADNQGNKDGITTQNEINDLFRKNLGHSYDASLNCQPHGWYESRADYLCGKYTQILRNNSREEIMPFWKEVDELSREEVWDKMR